MVFQRLAKPSRVKPLVGSNPTLSAGRWGGQNGNALVLNPALSGGVTLIGKGPVLKTGVCKDM